MGWQGDGGELVFKVGVWGGLVLTPGLKLRKGVPTVSAGRWGLTESPHRKHWVPGVRGRAEGRERESWPQRQQTQSPRTLAAGHPPAKVPGQAAQDLITYDEGTAQTTGHEERRWLERQGTKKERKKMDLRGGNAGNPQDVENSTKTVNEPMSGRGRAECGVTQGGS